MFSYSVFFFFPLSKVKSKSEGLRLWPKNCCLLLRVLILCELVKNEWLAAIQHNKKVGWNQDVYWGRPGQVIEGRKTGAEKLYCFPGGASGACHCRKHKRHGFDLRLVRSRAGGNDNPLQFSCLKNSMDRGAWWATVRGVKRSRTQLSIHT